MQKTIFEEKESVAVPAAAVRQLRLQKLTLRNFKGIQAFTLQPDGGSASVFGENAAGKSSLFDAFCWLLFGKDSQGRTDFEIKTLSANGEELHGLTHAVEAVVEIDGQDHTFLKEYEEKWTKQRGSATRTFTGHTTNHFIDGVPTKQADFQATIAELADERTFRLLTDPTFFSEGLHWQERRKILLEVCGDVSDADVIASDDRLADLPDILGKRSMEDHRKVVAAKRQEINRALGDLPTRIDECSRNLPEAVANPKQLQKQVEKLRLAREEAEAEISRINAGGEVAEQKKRLSEIGARMLELETAARREASDRYYAAVGANKNKLSDVLKDIREKEFEVAGNEGLIKNAQSRIETLESRMEELREEWNTLDARVLTYAGETVCAACGQDLPSDRVEEARQKAEEEFNAKKSQRLTQIREDGMKMGAEQKQLKGSIAALQNQIDVKIALIKGGEETAEKLKKEINDIPPMAEPKLPEEHAKLAHERGTIELSISRLKEDTAPALAAAREKITALSGDISELEASLASVELRSKGEARIEELKADEKRLAAEFEALERQTWLCDEFVRAKVSMLEERINSRFRMARFRLFETQINGGLVEVCHTSFKGVPWGSLNLAGKAGVGLDIIRTLQGHFGFAPVCWIDQAESYTSLPEMDCQLIRLVVSAGDKKLRVETLGS